MVPPVWEVLPMSLDNVLPMSLEDSVTYLPERFMLGIVLRFGSTPHRKLAASAIRRSIAWQITGRSE